MLKRVKFTTVPVKDQGRALEFWTKKVGLKVFTDQAMGPTRWIELKVPGAETMLVLHHRPDHVPGEFPAVSFETDDVKGTYDDLRAAGVEFTQPPKKEQWGEHAIFRDSEGNLVIFTKG